MTLFVRANGKCEIRGRDYARGRHADEFVAEQVSVDAWSRGLEVASEIDRIGGPGVRLETLADWDAENERLGLLLAKAKYLLGSRTCPGEWADAVPEALRNLLTEAVAKARERLDEGLEAMLRPTDNHRRKIDCSGSNVSSPRLVLLKILSDTRHKTTIGRTQSRGGTR